MFNELLLIILFIYRMLCNAYKTKKMLQDKSPQSGPRRKIVFDIFPFFQKMTFTILEIIHSGQMTFNFDLPYTYMASSPFFPTQCEL